MELERDRGEIEASGRFSLALLDGHVNRSARALASVDVVRAIPSLPVRRAAIGLGAVVAVMLLTVAIAPARVGGGLRRILAGDPAASRLALDPITGDVELTFRYPAYMRRAPKTLSGTGGEIRAPKGTEVALKTRADRPVKGAEVEVEVASRERGSSRKVPLTVTAERQLAGRFTVEGAGAYRFRFLDGRGRAVAEGPPIPIVVEPDAFPEVRITSPAQEVEVQPGATVKVEWLASDDVGLRDLTLVLKVGGGPEKRKVLRQLDGARRDGGGFDLELKPLGLGEGERLLYWLEATDGDAVSGPKKGASATQAVKIYSEAEHRRKLMEAARAAWEELVGVTGDHLELGARKLPAAQQLPLAEPLDGRVRRAHGRLREVAATIRQDKAGPKELARGLENVAGSIRIAEQRVSSARQTLARQLREGKGADAGLVSMTRHFDEQLDAELERGILYLEQLLDRQQSEDLVKMARDLAQSRRDLADLLDRYRRAPNDAAKQELVARIARMKERMNDLLRRMGEQAKGLSDEHMNQDALAELAKSKDVAGGLDKVEEALARGDVEAAMKALDEMGGAMDQMVAGLEKTAGMPSEKNRALMKELRAFKAELDGLRDDQRKLGDETERLREAWRERMAARMKEAERVSAARAARERRGAARDGVDRARGARKRVEPECERSSEACACPRSARLAARSSRARRRRRSAEPSVDRLRSCSEEDARSSPTGAAPSPRGQEPREVRRGARQARPGRAEGAQSGGSSTAVPEPAQLVLGQEEQEAAGGAGAAAAGARAARGALQSKLRELRRRRRSSRPRRGGHGRGARPHGAGRGGAAGRQRPARAGRAVGGAGGARSVREGAGADGEGRRRRWRGLPAPVRRGGDGDGGGEGRGAVPEKVEIPGAEAWRAPSEFRKDLLDAMKQGTPQRYEGEVKRYYEELVK